MCQISTGMCASLPDAQSFVDGGKHYIALVAHVSGVNAAEFRGFRGQCDQFFGLGVRSGRILQGG